MKNPRKNEPALFRPAADGLNSRFAGEARMLGLFPAPGSNPNPAVSGSGGWSSVPGVVSRRNSFRTSKLTAC